jgi:hypothetical protein
MEPVPLGKSCVAAARLGGATEAARSLSDDKFKISFGCGERCISRCCAMTGGAANIQTQ